MITQTTVRPSVWIGCLACYNEGILNGRWFPAEEAGEVTPEDLHLGPTYHDELWIFDHEGFGGVWVFRTVCFERVVLSSPGCLWPGRMDDHEEVLEAHA